MADMSQVAQRLRDLRAGKRRDEIAKACGISISALTMYENGNRIPRDEIKIKLARYYKRSIESIFFSQ